MGNLKIREKIKGMQKAFRHLPHRKKRKEIHALHRSFEDYLQESKTRFSVEKAQQYDYLISIKGAMGLRAEISLSQKEWMYDNEEMQTLDAIHSRIVSEPDFDADRFWRYVEQAQLQKHNQKYAGPESTPEHEHMIYKLSQSMLLTS